MRLLERDAPLLVLTGLLSEATQTGGRLVFVEGEAGIGKTSLLARFRQSVPPGVVVLMGSCDPLSTPRPLGPIVDIADDLDPSFAGLIRSGAPRDEILGALLASLRERTDGVVVLVDDLHWADEATLDALRFVGRRIDSTRALVVGTYRDDEVGRQHPLRVVVGDLATSPAVRRLPLEALSVASVGELARDTDLDPVELHRLTGGNPFYVTEVIAGAPARIPPTVRDAVLARAARLSPEARRTLEAAAVIGPLVDPALLSRVVDVAAAEECLAKGLLVATGERYAFRHEVAREAILQAIDPWARIGLHARVLAALEAEPEGEVPLARLAHHAEGAADRDAVLRYAPEAGRQAVIAGSHREAAAQYARAVRVAGNLPPVQRAALLFDFGIQQTAIVRYDVGLSALAEAVDIWRRLGDAPREAVTLAEMARILVGAGRNADAEDASRRAMEIAGRIPDGPAKVDAISAQAYLRMLDRDNAEAIELGRRAIAIGGDDPGCASQVILAWNTVGASRILLGDTDGGRADLETSLRLALESGNHRFAASAYSVMASALGEMYRFAEAEPYFEAGIRFAIERDLDAQRMYLEAWRSLSLMHRGHWSDAGALAASVLARHEYTTIGRIMTLLAVGRLRARRGDPDARTALDEAFESAAKTATLQRVGPVRAARAELAWLEGDPERAADEAEAVIDLARAKHHPWHIGELSWWRSQAGRDVGDVSEAAEPWRLQLAGQWREASDAWAALDCPYEAARALLDADDVPALEQAHATFDRLGARPAEALAARRLRELGARTIPRGRRQTTRANPAGLTARELEVLSLLVGGLPNHDIATRLFLSPRTVDHHVSAVLGKLGVARRADAAGAAAALGIHLQNGQLTAPD